MKRLFLAALILLSIGFTANAAGSNTFVFAYRNGDFEDLHVYTGRGYLHRGQLFICRSTLRKLKFDGALATIQLRNHGWLYVRRDGATRRTIFFDNGPDYFVEGLARYTTGLISGFDPNGKIGFINQHGDIVIPAQFEWASPFEHGYSVVCNGCQQVPDGEYHMLVGGQWGCMDKNGNVIIPVKYSEHEIYSKVNELPSLTTSWTSKFKDGSIILKIANTGEKPFKLEPTPIILTKPAVAFSYEDEISFDDPFGEKDVITPVITFVGIGLHDNGGDAGNGGEESVITVHPNETKSLELLYRSSDVKVPAAAAQSYRASYSLYLNNVEIHRLSLRKNHQGVWKEE